MWGKAGVDTAKVHQSMVPETACLLRAAYMGEAALRFCHIESMRFLDALSKESVSMHASERDKKLVMTVIAALKRAPWTMTKSYLEKCESGFLVFDGLGLYCRIGVLRWCACSGAVASRCGRSLKVRKSGWRQKFRNSSNEGAT
jgi:hypothetical protein